MQVAVWVEGVNVRICVGELALQKLLHRLTLLCGVASVEGELYAWIVAQGAIKSRSELGRQIKNRARGGQRHPAWEGKFQQNQPVLHCPGGGVNGTKA